MRKALLILAVSILAVSCGKGLGSKAEREIRQLCAAGELVTCEYTVSKVVKAEDIVWWKIGERKILFTLKAYLQAGIDMSKFDMSKVKADRAAKSIYLVLPAPELLSINIPPGQVRQEYSHITGLRFDFSAQEKNEFLKEGEKSVLADVPSLGIMKDAEANAVSFFQAMLSDLGFEDITIAFE